MQFRENNTPCFTDQRLDHLERYLASYGDDQYPPDWIAAERARVQGGNPSPCAGSNSKFYEIVHEDQHIGDLVLILNFVETQPGEPSEERYELDFMIYHEFSGKGFAKKALHEFVTFYKGHFTQPVESLVRKTNPLFEQVVHLLEGAGFVYESDLGSDVIYLMRMQ